MANNCLITKLKGYIDNDNLPIYDTIRLNVNIDLAEVVEQKDRIFRVTPENTTGVPLVLKNIGGYFCDSDGSNPVQTKSIVSGDTFIYYTAQTKKIYIIGKKNIRELISSWTNASINLITVEYKDLDYSSLYSLNLTNPAQTGFLKDFTHALSPRNAMNLTVSGTLIQGTLDELKTMTNLVSLRLTNCLNISGNVEDLAIYRQNGDTMSLTPAPGTVKYQGEYLTGNTTYLLTFDGFGGVTVTAG